jgi:IS1 family transposase
MDAATRQVIAFHVGDRNSQSARALWEKIPAVYHEQELFSTDLYVVYTGVIPPTRHRAIWKRARATTHVERFNCT